MATVFLKMAAIIMGAVISTKSNPLQKQRAASAVHVGKLSCIFSVQSFLQPHHINCLQACVPQVKLSDNYASQPLTSNMTSLVSSLLMCWKSAPCVDSKPSMALPFWVNSCFSASFTYCAGVTSLYAFQVCSCLYLCIIIVTLLRSSRPGLKHLASLYS